MRQSEPPMVLGQYLPVEIINRHDDDVLDVSAIFAFIQRNWRLWLIWLGLGICLAIAFMVVAPSYYTASSTLVFYDATNQSVAGRADALPSTFVDTQIEVLQSEQILDPVVNHNNLFGDAEFGQGPPSAGSNLRNATLKRVERLLSVSRVGTTDIVTVAFTSRDRERAARIANAIVTSYVAWRHNLGQEDSKEAVAELSKRLAAARAKALNPDEGKAPATAGSAAAPRAAVADESREVYRATYNNLLRQATTATTPYISPISMRVLTAAEPPLRRSWPKLIFVFGIAAVASAFAGFVHSLRRDFLDRSPKTVEALEKLTGLDCIAGIPRIEPDGWIFGTADTNGVQQSYLNASTDFCRALAWLAVRLQHNQRRPFAVGVAAATAGAGTSSVAAHLANLLAESGQKVLVIDADWKKSLPEEDELEATSGPNRMLARRLAAIHMEPGNLDVVLLRATAPISPVNASNSILTALRQMAANFDCVVVDFPSTDQTAALEATLGALDKVLLVTEAGRSPVENTAKLLKRLPAEKIEAVLVNKISSTTVTLAKELATFFRPVVHARQKFLEFVRHSVSLFFEEMKSRSLSAMSLLVRSCGIIARGLDAKKNDMISSGARYVDYLARICRKTISDLVPTVVPVGAAIGADANPPHVAFSALSMPVHDSLGSAEETEAGDVIAEGRPELARDGRFTSQRLIRFGLPSREEGARADQALAFIRRALMGEIVAFKRDFGDFQNLEVQPETIHKAYPSLWGGGFARAALCQPVCFVDGFTLPGPARDEWDRYVLKFGHDGRLTNDLSLVGGISFLIVSEVPDATFADVSEQVIYEINSCSTLLPAGGLVTAGGARSWIYRYTLEGRSREMGLGSVHAISLAEARIRAAERRKLRVDGIDLIDARRAKRNAARLEAARSMTSNACAAAYIDARKAAWQNTMHRDQWRNMLNTYANPVFGSIPVQSVDLGLVIKMLEPPPWGTKPETASRLRGPIEVSTAEQNQAIWRRDSRPVQSVFSV